MNLPRLLGFATALVLHGAAAYMMLARQDTNAFEDGNGAGNLNVVATVSLESGDLFTQEARQPSAEAVPSSAPPIVTPTKIAETEKAEPEAAALEQDTHKDDARQNDNPARNTAQPDRKKQEIASAAQDAEDAQQAAAAEAARRDRLWSVYQRELYSSLERHKVHVAKAGDVLLEITIAPSGALLDRTVTQSSGIPEVDRAAIAALERSAPFPAIPGGLSAGPLTLAVPFRFRIH